MGNGNKTNLKGRRELYLTVNLNPDTTWCRLGPIFWEVEVNSIDGVCDVGDPASNQHDSKSSNRYTTALLVINQIQLDWPRQKDFSCKRIE